MASECFVLHVRDVSVESMGKRSLCVPTAVHYVYQHTMNTLHVAQWSTVNALGRHVQCSVTRLKSRVQSSVPAETSVFHQRIISNNSYAHDESWAGKRGFDTGCCSSRDDCGRTRIRADRARTEPCSTPNRSSSLHEVRQLTVVGDSVHGGTTLSTPGRLPNDCRSRSMRWECRGWAHIVKVVYCIGFNLYWHWIAYFVLMVPGHAH